MDRSFDFGVLSDDRVRVEESGVRLFSSCISPPGGASGQLGRVFVTSVSRAYGHTGFDQAIAKLSGTTSEPFSGLGGVRNEIRQRG